MIGIVIPAHNEEAWLADCLRAAHAAAAHPALNGEAVHIVVALDACTDRSAAIARRYRTPTLTLDARNVGEARAAGADALLALHAPLARIHRCRQPRRARLARRATGARRGRGVRAGHGRRLDLASRTHAHRVLSRVSGCRRAPPYSWREPRGVGTCLSPRRWISAARVQRGCRVGRAAGCGRRANRMERGAACRDECAHRQPRARRFRRYACVARSGMSF